jgi:biopolymer transport protein ExbD
MAFGNGSTPGATSDVPGGDPVVPQMNVTPLVDVVLVLLITFMVITPLLTKTFWVHTPAQRTEEVERTQLADEQPLVLRITRDGTLRVNGADVTLAELPERLRRMFAARDDHVLFFDADDDASYGLVMQALDQAREGGAVTLGMLTSPMQATPAGSS